MPNGSSYLSIKNCLHLGSSVIVRIFLRQKVLMHKCFFLTQNIVGQFRLNCRVGTLEYMRELRVAV